MGEGFQLLDIILFAAIAAFLILRLRSVLGRRNGDESRPDVDPFKQNEENQTARKKGPAGEDKVVHLPNQKGQQQSQEDQQTEFRTEGPAAAGLTQIKLADSSFDEQGFMEGSRAAFEMIVSAFAAGDRETLRSLLADQVYEDFSKAIDEREKNNESLQTTIVSIKSADIVDARLENRVASIDVKFISEQINVTRDEEDRIIEGDPNEIINVTDIWTFERNTRSRDPNWALSATESPT
ncbi:MAG: Tim44/TimA family putative adaptor protein [Pseudomonadota bacterium]